MHHQSPRRKRYRATLYDESILHPTHTRPPEVEASCRNGFSCSIDSIEQLITLRKHMYKRKVRGASKHPYSEQEEHISINYNKRRRIKHPSIHANLPTPIQHSPSTTPLGNFQRFNATPQLLHLSSTRLQQTFQISKEQGNPFERNPVLLP